MRVFVTGGTGAIGRPAVSALIAMGHSVTALSRSRARSQGLLEAGAVPIEGSLFDRNLLARAFEGHDAVVNLATALPTAAQFANPPAWRENFRVRVEGSAAVVDAALIARVPRLVQESVCMIYQDHGADWIDETWPTDDFPTAHSNLAAEANTARFTAKGLCGTILRFGWFYGRGARHSEQFLTMARKSGVCVMLGRADSFVSSIHVADGGRAVEAALRAAAGIYNVVDDEPLTKHDYADALAMAAGRKTFIRAPGRIATLLGEKTTSLTRSLRVSNAKFKFDTGWSPVFPSARLGLAAMALRGVRTTAV